MLGENISQAASFVLSGSVDAGIVALSLALSPNMKGKGRYVEVPAADYPPIEPACVILKRWQRKDAARAFLQFIQSPATGELLRSYGLELRKRNEQRLVRYFFAFFAASAFFAVNHFWSCYACADYRRIWLHRGVDHP